MLKYGNSSTRESSPFILEVHGINKISHVYITCS